MQSGEGRVGIIECELGTAHGVLLGGRGNIAEAVGKRCSSRMASQRT